MEDIIAKLQKEQAAIKDVTFNTPPNDHVTFMRRWAEWYGLGKAIAFIEEEGRYKDDDEERS